MRRETITHRQLRHRNVLKLIGVWYSIAGAPNICPFMMVLPFLPTPVKVFLKGASNDTLLKIVRSSATHLHHIRLELTSLEHH